MAQRVERPEYFVADTWTYRRTDPAIPPQTFRTYTSTQIKTVTKVVPGEFELSTEAMSDAGEKTVGTETSSLDFNDYVQLSPDQPRQEIKAWRFPVSAGDTWKYEVPVKAGVQVWEVRVEGWEDAQVPAGRFKALKVERRLIADPGGGKARTVIVWFSPEAKVNVKREDHGNARNYTFIDSTRELLSYKVK